MICIPIYVLAHVLFITLPIINPVASAHGTINYPVPRGMLSNYSNLAFTLIDLRAPNDPHPHFPSGNKSTVALAGLRSQEVAAGPAGWSLYDPFKAGFKFRAGVCGDMIPPNVQHTLRGGKYYYNGTISSTYSQGQIISIGLSINGHHNGFMELYLCDVSKCPSGDISERCFSIRGACQRLLRAKNQDCDNGYSKLCGPIDRNYPGRWYFPCTDHPGDDITMDRWGQGVSRAILYKLPQNVVCEHCVLQWFWSAANTCNPPGVVDYFNGPDRPRNWGDCYGQGGASGGFSAVQRPCSKFRFSEEYFKCSDISINALSKPSIPLSAPQNDILSQSDIEEARNRGSGAIRAFVLIVDGFRHSFLQTFNTIEATNFGWVCVEVIAAPGVDNVTFSVDGAVTSSSTGPRFFGTGNVARGWGKLIPNQFVQVKAQAGVDSDMVHILVKNY